MLWLIAHTQKYFPVVLVGLMVVVEVGVHRRSVRIRYFWTFSLPYLPVSLVLMGIERLPV